MKNKISCVIITKNEEANIGRCLESVKWMDEIVVVDSGSTDRTVEICHSFGCKVIETEWRGFGKTKKFAVEQATNDWIFSIDADEEMTAQLRETIQGLLAETDLAAGYYVKRRSFYLDKLIRFSGWNRDYPLRFFNRRFGNFNEKAVHESVRISAAKKNYIESCLLHYTCPTIEFHLQKINLYSTLGAQHLFEKGRRSSMPAAIIRGKIKFLKMYILQGGFLDGVAGLILALNSAYGVYLKYLKLWKMTK